MKERRCDGPKQGVREHCYGAKHTNALCGVRPPATITQRAIDKKRPTTAALDSRWCADLIWLNEWDSTQDKFNLESKQFRDKEMHMNKFARSAAAAAMIGIAAFATAGSAGAIMLPVDLTTKKVVASHVTDVRYHRGGAAVAAGIALGIIGGAIASQYYYDPYPSYYYPPYAPPPAYYYRPGYYWGTPGYFYRVPVYRHHYRHRY